MIKKSKKMMPHKKRDDFELLYPNDEEAVQMTYNPSFNEKNRIARERLKNCPLPEELIEQMVARQNRLKELYEQVLLEEKARINS